jgi:hypothetical protein
MSNARFDVPVAVKFGSPVQEMTLRTAQDASDFLLANWPGKRSPKHREALQACHDAIAGAKPVMTARRAFLAVAREAGVTVTAGT